jgi:hypothetical protein
MVVEAELSGGGNPERATEPEEIVTRAGSIDPDVDRAS